MNEKTYILIKSVNLHLHSYDMQKMYLYTYILFMTVWKMKCIFDKVMANKQYFSYSPPKWQGQTASVAWRSHQMELLVAVVVTPEDNHLGKNVSYIENGEFSQF